MDWKVVFGSKWFNEYERAGLFVNLCLLMIK